VRPKATNIRQDDTHRLIPFRYREEGGLGRLAEDDHQLTSHETVVNSIGSTRTKKSLRVKAKLGKKQYETGKTIADEQMDQRNIKCGDVNPQWDYTVYPRTQKKKAEK